MKSISYLVGALPMLCSLLVGCGGNGGGVSAASSATTLNIAGHVLMTAGLAARDYAPSSTPQDVQLTVSGNPVTVRNVLVESSLTAGGPVTILLPGTKLVAGHYASQTGTLNLGSGGSVPLDSQGAFVQAIALYNGAGGFILPVDTIGVFSFPNGITVGAGSGGTQPNALNVTSIWLVSWISA